MGCVVSGITPELNLAQGVISYKVLSTLDFTISDVAWCLAEIVSQEGQLSPLLCFIHSQVGDLNWRVEPRQP